LDDLHQIVGGAAIRFKPRVYILCVYRRNPEVVRVILAAVLTLQTLSILQDSIYEQFALGY
jgi:hypothetical protein